MKKDYPGYKFDQQHSYYVTPYRFGKNIIIIVIVCFTYSLRCFIYLSGDEHGITKILMNASIRYSGNESFCDAIYLSSR